MPIFCGRADVTMATLRFSDPDNKTLEHALSAAAPAGEPYGAALRTFLKSVQRAQGRTDHLGLAFRDLLLTVCRIVMSLLGGIVPLRPRANTPKAGGILFSSMSALPQYTGLVSPLVSAMRDEDAHVVSMWGRGPALDALGVPVTDARSLPAAIGLRQWFAYRTVWRNWYRLLRKFQRQHGLRPGFVVRGLSELLKTLRLQLVFHTFLDRCRPRIVVVEFDRYPSTTALTIAARRLGIASVTLQHGVVSPFWGPLAADRIAVWGELSRRRLVAQAGVQADTIHVAGNLLLAHRSTDGMAPRPVRRAPVLVATNPLAENLRGQWLALALDGVAQAGCHAWVKPHPAEDWHWFAHRLRERTDVTLVEPGVRVSDLFERIDSVICRGSTVAPEAMANDVPVLILGPPGFDVSLAEDWLREGAARAVTDADEVAAQLQQLDDPTCREQRVREARAYLRFEFASMGAEACRAHVQLIRDLAVDQETA